MRERKKARRNWPCPVCGQWSSSGCEHINANSNRLKLRFQKLAEAIERLEAALRNELKEEVTGRAGPTAPDDASQQGSI
jgi:hypothetical protein